MQLLLSCKRIWMDSLLSPNWTKMLEIPIIYFTHLQGDSMTNFYCLSASFPPQTSILHKKLYIFIRKQDVIMVGKKYLHKEKTDHTYISH